MDFKDMNDNEKHLFRQATGSIGGKAKAKKAQEADNDEEETPMVERIIMSKPGLVIILTAAGIVGAVVYHQQIKAALRSLNLNAEDMVKLLIGTIVANEATK